jgi:riboflavin kinase/FMN adenylyltransferase
MRILPDRKDKITVGSICAIGGFDGVHRGHQSIVSRVKTIAGSEYRTGIITFTPVPFFVMMGKPQICLTSRKEKESVFRSLGIDFIYYFGFTERFSRLSPERFVSMITRRIKPKAIVVGANFSFGFGKKGSARTLKELAAGSFTVHIIPPIKNGEVISSTRIRELLLLGNIKAANILLGREYEIHGRVIKGKGRGTRLGFPTVNLKISKGKLMPLDGVYSVHVLIDNRQYKGAMFCHQHFVEVHILDYKGILYERSVSVAIQRRIRAIKRFHNDNDLRTAIAADVEMIGKHN